MFVARFSSLTNASNRSTAPILALLLVVTLSGLLALPRLLDPLPAAAPVAPALPLLFTERVGTANEPAVVEAGTLGAAFTFTAEGVSLNTPTSPAFQLTFPGANPDTTMRTVEPKSTVVSSYQGSDPARWSEATPTYGAVVYDDLFPGVSLHIAGDNRQLKGTYTVAPHANPTPIAWRYPGASNMQIDPASGDLQITLGAQTLVERAPIAWQNTAQGRVLVDVRFAIAGDTAGFVLGSYDPTLPLVIDPELVYSSYFGGNSDEESYGMVRDAQGSLYLIGRTYSTDFGGSPNSIAGNDDVFIAKLDSTGKQLLYRTILGGSGSDGGIGIAVNTAGEVALTANTGSTNFPLLNPLLSTRPGPGGAFARLDAAGRLVFSSYINIGFSNSRQNIAFDRDGNMVFTGTSWASDDMGDAGIYVVKGDGSEAVRAIGFGGDWLDEGAALAIGANGNIYLAGVTQPNDQGIAVSDNAFQQVCGARVASATGSCDKDAFIAVLNPELTELIAGTYLGGVGTETVAGIGVDGAGNVYVAGTTGAMDFPTSNAFQPTWLGADNFSNGFVAKLSPDLSAAVYSTFLSSQDQTGTEQIFGLAVDGAGNAAVTGLTNGRMFPIKEAVENELDGRICRTTTERLCYDAFAVAFDPNGGLAWSTYLGGDDDDQGRAITFDGAGGVWVTGQTDASDFSTTADAQSNLQMSDVFLTHLGTNSTPAPSPTPGGGGGTNQPFKVVLPLIKR
jgi:hypothetical protein